MTDWHAKGQQATAKSRDNSIQQEAEDQILSNGRYDAPSDPGDREQFFKGVHNAEKQPPLRQQYPQGFQSPHTVRALTLIIQLNNGGQTYLALNRVKYKTS